MSEHFFSQKIRTLFDRFDLDKNGMIEVYFLPADTNNDGSVEVNELVDHMQAVNY